MIINPYDTTALSAYQMDKVEHQLMVEDGNLGGLYDINVKMDNDEYTSFAAVTKESGNISVFSHPIYSPKKCRVYVDARPYIKHDKHDAPTIFKVRDGVSFKFTMARGMILSRAIEMCDDVVKEGDMEMSCPRLMNMSNLPIKAYAKLIASVLERRLDIDKQASLTTEAIAAAFYCRLHYGKVISDRISARIIRVVSNATSLSVDNVTRMLEGTEVVAPDLKFVPRLETLIESLKRKVESPRADLLDIGVIVASVSGGWRSIGGREFISSALEHPPSWVLAVVLAATDRTYNKSEVAMVLNGPSFKRNDTSEYMQSFRREFGTEFLDTIRGNV